MTNDERRSSDGRRSGKDRRSGVDTRSEEERRLIGERRSTNERRSGLDRRSINKANVSPMTSRRGTQYGLPQRLRADKASCSERGVLDLKRRNRAWRDREDIRNPLLLWWSVVMSPSVPCA